MATLSELIKQVSSLHPSEQIAARQQVIDGLGLSSDQETGSLFTMKDGPEGQYRAPITQDDFSPEEWNFIRGSGDWQGGYQSVRNVNGANYVWSQDRFSANSTADPKGGFLTPYNEVLKANKAKESGLNKALVNAPVAAATAAIGAGATSALSGAGAAAGAAEGAGTVAAYDAGLAGTVGSEALYGGASTVAPAVGAESFVDPWDVMGDTSKFGLQQPAAPGLINSSIAPAVAESAPAATSVAPEVSSAASASPAAAVAAETGASEAFGLTGMEGGGANTVNKGLLDSAIDWAKANPTLAATGVTVAGGIIKGAMTPSPKEQADAVMQAKVQADTQAAAAKRASNRLENISLSRLRPTGATIQRPKLIANAMR